MTSEAFERPGGTLLSPATAGAYLRTRNILPRGPFQVEEFGGGVSNVVLAVSWGGGRVVVKQALPRLRVEEEWLAKQERAINEARALELAGMITPGRVPAVLDVDSELCALTVAAAPAEWTTWKHRLLGGEADESVASELGALLAAWHGATFRDDELARSYGDYEVFEQLRVDPFYRSVARRATALADAIEGFVERMGENRVCAVHGDYSPKNVLLGRGL